MFGKKIKVSCKNASRYLLWSSGCLLLLVACRKWDLDKISFLQLAVTQVTWPASTTAAVNIQIEGLEGQAILDVGLLWSSQDSLPVKGNEGTSIIQLGAREQDGELTVEITELNPNVPHWLRVYAELPDEVVYSKTVALFPAVDVQVEMLDLTVIRGTVNAVATSSITGPTGTLIDAYGHCWTDEPRLPVIDDNRTVLGTIETDYLAYTSTITNLLALRQYYIRPYAIVGNQVFYGAVDSLNKGDIWVPRNQGPWTTLRDFDYYSTSDKAYLLLLSPFGTGEDHLWCYDPISDDWSQKKDFPGPMRGYTYAVNTEEKLYVGLGSLDYQPPFTDFWEYDIATDEWTRKKDFPQGGRTHATGFVLNGEIYLAFGEDLSGWYDNIWRFDPDDGPDGNWHFVRQCDCPPRTTASAFVIDDKAYIVGGTTPEVVVFDPSSSQFPCYVKDVAFRWVRYNPATAVIAGKGYFGAGGEGSGNIKSDFWEFDPTYTGNGFDIAGAPLGQWTQLKNFTNDSINDGRSDPAVFALQGRLFGGFGIRNSDADHHFWEYIFDKK